jgi:hypothetical protein
MSQGALAAAAFVAASKVEGQEPFESVDPFEYVTCLCNRLAQCHGLEHEAEVGFFGVVTPLAWSVKVNVWLHGRIIKTAKPVS